MNGVAAEERLCVDEPDPQHSSRRNTNIDADENESKRTFVSELATRNHSIRLQLMVLQ